MWRGCHLIQWLQRVVRGYKRRGKRGERCMCGGGEGGQWLQRVVREGYKIKGKRGERCVYGEGMVGGGGGGHFLSGCSGLYVMVADDSRTINLIPGGSRDIHLPGIRI